jgi:hypothetical protein
MGRLWSFVEQKQNREIPTWISTSLAVAIAGLWTALAYFAAPPDPPAIHPEIGASCGSPGIGGDVHGATIPAGDTASCVDRKP